MGRNLRTFDPAPEIGRHLHLERLKRGKELTVRIVSKTIWSYWSHWYNGHSHPCPGDNCTCPPPRSQCPREWHGILHVVNVASKKDFLLEITSHCWILFKDQVPDPEMLRGLRVTFSRSNGGNNGRLRAQLDEVARLVSDLPPERSPEETLGKLHASKRP